MDNLKLYNIFRDVPETAKKKINGGRMNGKTDINPMWRLKSLTEQFGPCGIGWYYKTIKQWVEPYNTEVAAFVNIELYIKHDGEWSMPIFGTGGSMFVANEKSGPYVSDECFKMATTDAISVACKQLGIGADVYWGSDKTKYEKSKESTATVITKKQADDLKSLVLKKGLDINKVFNVPVEQLTNEQYKDAMQKLQKIKVSNNV